MLLFTIGFILAAMFFFVRWLYPCTNWRKHLWTDWLMVDEDDNPCYGACETRMCRHCGETQRRYVW